MQSEDALKFINLLLNDTIYVNRNRHRNAPAL